MGCLDLCICSSLSVCCSWWDCSGCRMPAQLCRHPQCSSNCSSAETKEKCDVGCSPWWEMLYLMAEVCRALGDWVCLYSKSKIHFCECKLMQTYLMRENPAWLATPSLAINKYFTWKNFLAGKCDSLECWWTNSKFCGFFVTYFQICFLKLLFSFVFVCVVVCVYYSMLEVKWRFRN